MNYEIKIKDGESTLILPKKKVARHLADACEEELKALIATAATETKEEAMELCSLSSDDYDAAISFWRGASVVVRKTKEKKKAEQKDTPTLSKIEEQGLPEYTSDEVVRITSSDRVFTSIIDEAQRVYGKMFNTVEMNYIIAMRDHLSLDGEYILILLQYFRAEGKPLCYIAKVAENLAKRGILSPLALEEYIKNRETFKGIEGQYRKLFGIGSRDLTPTEEKYFHSWSAEMSLPFELVSLAFERTIERKNTPSKAYMNGILSSWYSSGLKSEEDVIAHEQSQKSSKSKTSSTTAEGSFDIGEFFTAALERTYGKGE